MLLSTLPLRAIGEGLLRPECVCPAADGRVFVPNWDGGVSIVDDEGRTTTLLAKNAPVELRPNGVAFTPKGDVLLANLGAEGGVWCLRPDGEITPILTAIGGVPLPPTNFAMTDTEGRTWVSVSTARVPRQQAWRPHVRDGFVVVIDAGIPRLAVDNLHYTNEVRPDPSGRWLYVVETFGQRLVRFEILRGAQLGPVQLVFQFDAAFFPDGFAFDREDGIWVTSLISNRVIRLNPDRTITEWIDDVDRAFLANAVAAFGAGTMEAPHLGPMPGARLQHVTSIAFGGPAGTTGYLGSLHANCIYTFSAPVPGVLVPFATEAARRWSA